MYLIAGLGNPGEKYEHTRHNVGFDVLALLADRLKIPVRRLHHQALVGEGVFAGQKVALCLPQTYMNLSGDAVSQLLRWYKIPPENLLVIYDDIDLAPGWLRIRPNGSAGTHNGMRSIVASIGTDAFPRIRVGIGGKPPAFELADWVLSRYHTPQEHQTAFDAYSSAADAAMEWMRSGVQSAMNKYNTQKPKPPKPPKAEALPETAGACATGATARQGSTEAPTVAASAGLAALIDSTAAPTAPISAGTGVADAIAAGQHLPATSAKAFAANAATLQAPVIQAADAAPEPEESTPAAPQVTGTVSTASSPNGNAQAAVPEQPTGGQT